ncbi:MAG: UbiA family prenyltransferase [Candidatus Moranbacteria bacterium]|nr:UbiA family prenyltransferase [Candidatus Moranbacteria bacterium]
MIQRIIDKIESYPLSIPQFLLAFSAIIAVRMLGENLLMGLGDKSLGFFIGSALAAYLFFLFSFLLVLIFLAVYLKENLQKISNVLLWGFWLAVLPPILDKILCGSQKCWSFYAFDSLSGLLKRFFTFFGSDPTLGITYGVRIEVALAVIFVAIYIFLKTKNVLKSAIGAILLYIILFILGSFPSWLAYFLLFPEKSPFLVQGFDVAGLFLSPMRYFSIENGDILNALNVKMNLVYAFLIVFLLSFSFWSFYREKFWLITKNVRWIQVSMHIGIVLAGAGLGAFYYPQNASLGIFSFLALANLILAAVFAWLASVFLNDREDVAIDRLTNFRRPLASGKMESEEYGSLFLVSFLASLILALTVGVKFFLLILAYQFIAWAYSSFPYRLKRFPVVSTFLSAWAFLILCFSGFILISDSQNLSGFPAKFIWLLVFSLTLSLPIKDLKDIEGDKYDGVWTIPVLLGETWGRFAIGLGIFASYGLSVVLLNAKILFFPAMILGALSFWIMQNKKIPPRRVHIWVFGLLFIYVFILVYLVFYPAFGLNLRV